MYSNSNLYLNGGNSSRPGGPPQSQLYQPQQQAPLGTGFAVGTVQPQFTGYPGVTSQPTGYAQNTTPIGAFNVSGAGYNAPQSLQPMRTGQTSSQIAQSFQPTTKAQASQPLQVSLQGPKIPKIRLSFLTAQDQAKFEQLFKSAVGDGQALDGDKVRDLLLRSKLAGSDLMQIWVLSDTTKSGQLLFPEFALAMYLCNLRIVGKELPTSLPERVANEVSSMVDIISFGVPDEQGQQQRPIASQPPVIQQPRAQATNSQLLGQLSTQPTGFIGSPSPQFTSLRPDPTGHLAMGASAVNQGNTAPSTYVSPGGPSNLRQVAASSQQFGVSAMALNAQPTGIPGQWGLVNTPSTGLPNIEALQQRMMPQQGREGGFSTVGLTGTASVPWAVTKDEKRIYDQLFKAWDGLNKGFIGGNVAIEVMGQSGLPKPELEKIWTLSDPSNKGKLDMDEFAVAMHVIYRKLNGYAVPNRLPPELVPPSTRHLADSIGTMKSLLLQDAEQRKSTGAYLQPQQTGVSYLKNHSFRSGSPNISTRRKDATVFRNNDDDVGYRSSARRRAGAGIRTPSPGRAASPSSETSKDQLSLDQLKKMVHEKQVLLDAMDFQDENAIDGEEALDRKDRREAEEFCHHIRRVQGNIDSHSATAERTTDSRAERRTLKRQLQSLIDKIPALSSNVRKTEREIADARLVLFRIEDAKAHPNSGSSIVGTGPGGIVTEADRLKARAMALMRQRSAALTGKGLGVDNLGGDDGSVRRREEETSRIKDEMETNERLIKDVEEGVTSFSRKLDDNLVGNGEDRSSDHERRRWEDGLGVEDDVREFISDLQRESRATRTRNQGERSNTTRPDTIRRAPTFDSNPAAPYARPQDTQPEDARPSQSRGANSHSTHKTAEERAAFIKQQAEQRMNERLAALGLKPPGKPSAPKQAPQEIQHAKRDDPAQSTEAQVAQREQERQHRLVGNPPSQTVNNKGAGRKPPPPPTRKGRVGSASQQAVAGTSRARAIGPPEELQKAALEAELREQQRSQETKTEALVVEARRQDDELAQQKRDAESRLRALEEQVRAGKLKKQEEKRRRLAVDQESKEKEARFNTQRAELAAAQERERQLQLQLENLQEDDSSDDDDINAATPQDITPTSSRVVSTEPTGTQSLAESVTASHAATASEPNPIFPSSSGQPPSAHTGETKNPFFKQLNLGPEASSTLQRASLVTSPQAPETSTNPFQRIAQQEQVGGTSQQQDHVTGTGRIGRARQEEDEWSVVDSTGDSSDDESDLGSGRPGAKQLASMLFGTMGPPRPLSAVDEKFGPTIPPAVESRSPQQHEQEAHAVSSPQTMSDRTTSVPEFAPPLLPPMPSGEAPPLPPPPPPPLPDSLNPPGSAPPPPPMLGGYEAAGSAPPPPSMMSIAADGPPGAPPPPPSVTHAPSNGMRSSRGALLGDIHKGKGLKKVKTKDRSTASTAGRVL